MTRWSTYAALMLAALALAAPAGAQTGNPELGRVLRHELESALTARGQAGAVLSAQVERARARHELESALTARGQALNEMLAASHPAAQSPAPGFDWGAAAAGAGAILALVMGALATVFLVRRGRHAVPDAL